MHDCGRVHRTFTRFYQLYRGFWVLFVVVEHRSVVYHVVGALGDLRFIWSLGLSATTSFAPYFSMVGIHMLFTECVERLPFRSSKLLISSLSSRTMIAEYEFV